MLKKNSKDDGYKIVDNFLKANPFIVGKLEASTTSPFTANLLKKYFTVTQIFNNIRRSVMNIKLPHLMIVQFGSYLNF